MKNKAKLIEKESPYVSGSPRVGTTLKEELKTFKANRRKGKLIEKCVCGGNPKFTDHSKRLCSNATLALNCLCKDEAPTGGEWEKRFIEKFFYEDMDMEGTWLALRDAYYLAPQDFIRFISQELARERREAYRRAIEVLVKENATYPGFSPDDVSAQYTEGWNAAKIDSNKNIDKTILAIAKLAEEEK